MERLGGPDFIGYCGLLVGGAGIEEPGIRFEFAKFTHGNGYAAEAARAVVTQASSTGRQRISPDPERGDTVWMTRDLI